MGIKQLLSDKKSRRKITAVVGLGVAGLVIGKHIVNEIKLKEKLKNVTGITGIPGSGKTFCSQVLSEETGIEHLMLDREMNAILKNPLVVKISGEHINNEDDFKDPEEQNGFDKLKTFLIMQFTNLVLKNIITKSDGPLIIDSWQIPKLPIAEKFGANYLVESVENEDKRAARLARRDGTSEKTARKKATYMANAVKGSNLRYTGIIENDCETVPPAIQEIAKSLNADV